MDLFAHETIIRPATDADWPFITSSWLRSYRHSAFASHIPPSTYFTFHHRVVDQIKERGGKFNVVALVNDPETVLGFSCHEGDILHYIYIKLSFRRIGLAGSLVKSLDVSTVSHLTKAGLMFKISRLPQSVYNPYSIWRQKERHEN